MELSNQSIIGIMSRIICILITVLLINGLFISVCRAESPQLSPSKVETPPAIDGILDDECWLNAAKGENFTLYDEKKAPQEQTEFFICYDDTNIYIAFHCFDSQPDKIIATQKERDGGIWNDDYVSIYLDTYHEHRNVECFYVNAIGTQRDYRTQGSAGKIEWKGDWSAAAITVEDGWTVEIEIPFAILSYNPNGTSMGFNASRSQQRLDESSTWFDANTCEDYGDLIGMELPATKKQPVKIMPYVLFEASEDNQKRPFRC